MDLYEFRIAGQLSDRWSERLGGLAVQRREDGTTTLVGPVRDQADLHGIFIRMRNLGLSLLSLRRLTQPRHNDWAPREHSANTDRC